jgi:1,4-alpha-glucan branching enzyme
MKKIETKLFDDEYLKPHFEQIKWRIKRAEELETSLTENKTSLANFASGHEYYGLHKKDKQWIFREWAPNATAIFLIGDFNDWKEREDYLLSRTNKKGDWEIELPLDAIYHENLYKLKIYWDGGDGERLPSYTRRVVQDEQTKMFSSQVWAPAPYKWEIKNYKSKVENPLIYEAHVGMSGEEGGVNSYLSFADNILPKIVNAGYNTIQLMAIMEHPYYGSFGYHVSNFFAVSSRCGTPEEFKYLVDKCHQNNISIIIDIVHSHSVSNELEGLGKFDGTEYQYFHEGAKGKHQAWDSLCFNYTKPEVLHFLLSNCRFWLDEYKVDGFRFDGVTSMLYFDHGLGTNFCGYEQYFDSNVDEDALSYLILANKLIHELKPHTMSVAEDVSGMPGLAAEQKDFGIGFDYRLALGVPDTWFDLIEDIPDENWNMGKIWHELTNRRTDEKTISYVECHDQAIVGGRTLMFSLADAAMYTGMGIDDQSLAIDRAIALHKMIRIATLSTAAYGYLNFMGNEFGHPEWIDFPREGNNWSYHYARRQWSLRYDQNLKFRFLAEFDRAMIELEKQTSYLQAEPRMLQIDELAKTLCFERAGLIFIYNFNPDNSATDYQIQVPPGKYELALNSDDKQFGGFDRIANAQQYISQPTEQADSIIHTISVYSPARTVIVLKKRN